MEKEIKEILKGLKNKERVLQSIPPEYQYNKEVLKTERKNGLRIDGKRGFDVIKNQFFVEGEIVSHIIGDEFSYRTVKDEFDSFEDYYEFLDGDIYNNACYKYLDFDKYHVFFEEHDISVDKMYETSSFISGNINDYKLEASEEEVESFNRIKRQEKLRDKWIERFYLCKNYVDFKKTILSYKKSPLYKEVGIQFFLFTFLNSDNLNRLDIVLDYLNGRTACNEEIVYGLCLEFDPDRVYRLYSNYSGADSTIKKHKKRFYDFVNKIKTGDVLYDTTSFFDKRTHYYCTVKHNRIGDSFRYYYYFETFEEFARFNRYDLRNTDLSGAIELKLDLDKYLVDESTKLPVNTSKECFTIISKYYSNERFCVDILTKHITGAIIKKEHFESDYFFDFVDYLCGDLSDANLLMCPGLSNISSLDNVNLEGAHLSSELCERFGIKYECINIDEGLVRSFDNTLILEEKDDSKYQLDFSGKIELSLLNEDEVKDYWKVFYITDLHLMHRISHANCKSIDDVKILFSNIVDRLNKNLYEFYHFNQKDIILIGGDVSSDYSMYKLFVNILCQKINCRIVFVLGNHDLWGCKGNCFREIESIYKEFLKENNCVLLQNEVLYLDSNYVSHVISEAEILSNSVDDMRTMLKDSRLVIFGGLGFAGKNCEFNAMNGIYNGVINIEEEIQLSAETEKCYKKVWESCIDKELIVLTHNPIQDWANKPETKNHVIYISGHNHLNYFYDDGDIRIYSDNQIGYRNEYPSLKFFLLDNRFDVFRDYEDGIFEISSEQYNLFYQGKNIQMTFNRNINVLYMLKKNGFYCFIHKSKNNHLCILNGGALKKLEKKDINYYYQNMDKVINVLYGPIEKYMLVQKEIASFVKQFGGIGNIHGCIIDIDYYNHIYLNPIDLKITYYWAENIINKHVYDSLPTLLKDTNSLLFLKYNALLRESSESVPAVIQNNYELTNTKQTYFSTDIYNMSRSIKKLQKLDSNILSIWVESGEKSMTDLLESVNRLDKRLIEFN